MLEYITIRHHYFCSKCYGSLTWRCRQRIKKYDTSSLWTVQMSKTLDGPLAYSWPLSGYWCNCLYVAGPIVAYGSCSECACVPCLFHLCQQVIKEELYRNIGLALISVAIMTFPLIADLQASLLVFLCVLLILVSGSYLDCSLFLSSQFSSWYICVLR